VNHAMERNVIEIGCGQIQGSITAFACKDWGKPWKTSVRIASVQA